MRRTRRNVPRVRVTCRSCDLIYRIPVTYEPPWITCRRCGTGIPLRDAPREERVSSPREAVGPQATDRDSRESVRTRGRSYASFVEGVSIVALILIVVALSAVLVTL